MASVFLFPKLCWPKNIVKYWASTVIQVKNGETKIMVQDQVSSSWKIYQHNFAVKILYKCIKYCSKKNIGEEKSYGISQTWNAALKKTSSCFAKQFVIILGKVDEK